jgi:hypothetical protein
LAFVDFGAELKDLDRAKTCGAPFVAIFRLLSCDLFSSIALGQLQQRIRSFASIERKAAVISALISALSSLTTISYTLRTRVSVVAWSLDSNYVSFALPQFSLDFVDALAKEAKLHIDIRRTIVSTC